MLPSDGVTTERPIDVMSKRKKDNEFLAAFKAATAIEPALELSQRKGMVRTDKQKRHGARSSAILVDVSVISKVCQHFHDEEDDRSRDIVLRSMLVQS
jgi:hypothetical protein